MRLTQAAALVAAAPCCPPAEAGTRASPSPAAPPAPQAAAPATDAAGPRPRARRRPDGDEPRAAVGTASRRRGRLRTLARPGRRRCRPTLPAASPSTGPRCSPTRPAAELDGPVRRLPPRPAALPAVRRHPATSCAPPAPRRRPATASRRWSSSTACPTGPRPRRAAASVPARRPARARSAPRDWRLREDGRVAAGPRPRPSRSTSAGGARGTSPTARSSSRRSGRVLGRRPRPWRRRLYEARPHAEAHAHRRPAARRRRARRLQGAAEVRRRHQGVLRRAARRRALLGRCHRPARLRHARPGREGPWSVGDLEEAL